MTESKPQNIKWSLTEILLILGLLALTAWSHVSLLDAGFLLYDDEAVVVGNPAVHLGSVGEIFTSFTAGLYHPLTTMSWAVEANLFGFNPRIFHSTNIVLHLIAIVLVFLLARRLWQPRLRSAPLILAALFALHPLHTESVAWITERKDLLCQIFYLLALYWQAGRQPGQSLSAWRWDAVFCATIAALLAKPMAVTLPMTLVLIDIYRHQGVCQRRFIYEKIPHACVALIFAIVTVIGQTQLRGEAPWAADFVTTVSNATKFILMLLSSAVLPTKLSVIYDPAALSLVWQYVVPAIAVLAGGTLATVLCRDWRQDAQFGLLFFLITVLPVMRLAQFGDASVFNDRFFYLPGIGLLWATVSLVAHVTQRIQKKEHAIILLSVLWTPVISLFAFATDARCRDWKNDETLMQAAIREFPNVSKPYTFLAQFYARSERHGDAVKAYRQALTLSPKDPVIASGLAYSLFFSGQHGEATQVIEHALQTSPRDSEILYTAGIIRLESGNIKAGRELLTAARTAPSSLPPPYRRVQIGRILNTLGVVALREGSYREALELVNQALEEGGSLLPEPHYNQGLIYRALGRPDAALQSMQRALSLAPKLVEAQADIAVLYWEHGERDRAIAAMETATQLAPKNLRYHCNLLFFHEKSGNRQAAETALATLQHIAPGATCLPPESTTPAAP